MYVWWWGVALLGVGLLVLAFGARVRSVRTSDSSPSAQSSMSAEKVLAAGTHRRELQVDGRKRSYLVHAPSGLPSGPAAVVLVFHGGGGNAENAMRMSHFDRAADTHGFVAVFPEGGSNILDSES